MNLKREYRQLYIFGNTRNERLRALALLDSVEFYNDKMIEARKLFDENDAVYIGEFCGWFMTHKFRAKNSFGSIDIDELSFYFNRDLTGLIEPFGKRKIESGYIPKHAPL